MTRKLAVVALMALVLSGPALAQKKAIDFSLKGGINLANLVADPEPDPNYERLMRYGGGATLGFNIRPGFSVDADVLYMMKGAKWEFSEGDHEETSEVKLDYLVINPMIRFAPAENRSGVYIMGGAEIGFLMNAEISSEVKTPGGTETVDEDVKDELKGTDLCLNVGLGFQFGGEGKTAIFVEGRYSLGLVDINDTDDEEVEGIPGEEAPKLKTQGIYLLAGIRL